MLGREDACNNPFNEEAKHEGNDVEDDPTRPESEGSAKLAAVRIFCRIKPLASQQEEHSREDEPQEAVAESPNRVSRDEGKLVER